MGFLFGRYQLRIGFDIFASLNKKNNPIIKCLSFFTGRRKREVFSKGPRSKQLYDRLLLQVQTPKTLDSLWQYIQEYANLQNSSRQMIVP